MSKMFTSRTIPASVDQHKDSEGANSDQNDGQVGKPGVGDEDMAQKGSSQAH